MSFLVALNVVRAAADGKSLRLRRKRTSGAADSPSQRPIAKIGLRARLLRPTLHVVSTKLSEVVKIVPVGSDPHCLRA